MFFLPFVFCQDPKRVASTGSPFAFSVQKDVPPGGTLTEGEGGRQTAVWLAETLKGTVNYPRATLIMVVRAGEMVPWVNSLLHKHKDQSSFPGTV